MVEVTDSNNTIAIYLLHHGINYDHKKFYNTGLYYQFVTAFIPGISSAT
jgi:hypothetical protein